MLNAAQVRYLTEVLGIESVIRGKNSSGRLSRNAAVENESVSETSDFDTAGEPQPGLFRQGALNSPFVFFVRSSTDNFESGAEHELLEKIIVATKLRADLYSIVQVESVSDVDRHTSENSNQAAIYFGGVQAGSIKKYGDCAVLFTHSLKQLLVDQGLKKSTWTGLQEILKGSLK